MRTALLAIVLSLIPCAAADLYTFTALGPTQVESLAGSVTAWGYSIANQSSSLWLVTTDLNAGTFQYATPTTLFDFPDIAPGTTATVLYNPLSSAGLFQILWDPATPAGFVNSGSFNLGAQWWNGDPLAGGAFVSQAPGANQPYSVSLTATPEPAGSLLMVIGLSVVALALSPPVRAFLRG